MRTTLKWLLGLLVAANIVVWGAWVARDRLVGQGMLPGPPPEEVEIGAEPLPPIARDLPDQDQALATLGSGRDAPGLAEPSPPGFDTPPSSTPVQELLACVVAGPYNDRETAAAEAERLRTTGAGAQIEEESVVAEPHYMVFVDPAVSLDEAHRTRQALEARDIDDVAVIGTGSRANGVSVGIFGTRDNAAARQQRIAALGYSVGVAELDRDQVVFRLRIRDVAIEAVADTPHTPCPDVE